MPDNVTVGLNTVAADELETVNGVAQVEPLPKAERVKIGHGVDSDFTDASATNPFPTVDAAVQQAVADLAAAMAAGSGGTVTLSGPVEVDNASGGPLSVKQTGVAPPLGYQQVPALTTSQALPSIPAGAVTAIVTPRAPVRWRDDGTAPTASAGMYLAADQPLTYQGSLAALRLIAVTGSVEVNIAYYGAEA